MSVIEARDFLMSGSYDRAKAAFEGLLRDPRQVLEAGLGLARCRYETGDYAEGLRGLADLNGKSSAEWHYLSALFHECLGQYDDVLKHAQEAVERDGNHAGARLLLGQMLEGIGRRDEAIEAYRWFDGQLAGRAELPRDAEWLTHAAVGFLRFSTLTQTSVVPRTKYVLKDLLQAAYDRLDRTYWPARIAAADLLREKFNNDEQHGSLSDYLAALKLNEHLPSAHVGIGQIALSIWNFDEVERRVEKALATNPRFAPALHLRAQKLIVERRYEEARQTCNLALEINEKDVKALALSAAASACRYDESEVAALRISVRTINPKPGEWHRTLGDALSGIRQYAASEREYLQALEYEPTDANARTELGMMYMQWGLEDKAQESLEAAWRLDPFNERTHNTLELLTSLRKFDRTETDHFIIKFDAAQDPGLGEFVAPYLEELYGPITRDYAVNLKDKTIIEIFPSQGAFAVRITGKPWIHTVGACTGRVIALASPRPGDDRIGRYNLARVLRHEFTHTVTLAATENRIPHWFTEGLAVYQEDAPRSFDWTELLAEAGRRSQLFTLQSIDWGFMRPRRPQDRTMAYAQSEWMCEYIVERFGYDAINAMIERYRRGETQPQVFREQLGIEVSDFDRDFVQWAQRQIAQWGYDLTPPENVDALKSILDSTPDDAAVHGRLARAAFDADDLELALNAAGRALELDDDEPNAMTVLVTILAARARQEASEPRRRHYEDELISRLEKLRAARPDDRIGPKLLSEVLLRRKEWDQAIEPLTRLQRLNPMDPASWSGLAGVYLEKKDGERALVQLLELARTEEHDPDVPAKIADIYRKKSQLREAQYWYRQALFIDPFSAALHKELSDTAMQAGDTAAALQSYLLLTKLESKNPRHFESAAFAALKLGRTEESRTLAAKAVELDAQSPARTLLP